MTGGWRKLHNRELCNVPVLFTQCCRITGRGVGLLGHVARIGKMKNVFRIIRKHEGKRAFEKPCHRLNYIVIVILHEEADVDWSRVVQIRV